MGDREATGRRSEGKLDCFLNSDVLLQLAQLFKDATTFFSRSTPYLAKVIPAMDHIDQHLATAARNKAYKLCIQAAVAMGKKLLNKYYSYTDHSELYRIAMGKFRSLDA